MKILIITKNFTPSTIPDAKRFTGISDFFMSKGHSVTVITETKKSNITQDHNLTIKHVFKVGEDSKGMFQRLLNHTFFMIQVIVIGLFTRKHDIVLATSPPLFNLIAGRIISFFKKSKYVVDLRDLWPDVFEQTGVMDENNFVYKMFDRIAYKCYQKADLIAVVTPGKKTLLDLKYPDFSTKTHILSNGFNISVLDHTIDQNIAENFKSGFNVIYTGKIGLAQDLGSFVRLASNHKQNKNIHFHIFGSGKDESKLLQMIKEEKLENIKFYGYRSEKEIVTALKHSQVAYVSLNSSKLIDSIPSKLYEAILFENIILLSAKGDSETLVTSLGIGLASSPGDFEELSENFSRIYNDYDHLSLNKTSAVEHLLQHYSRDVVAAKYEELLSKIVRD